jgi:glycosyltransferase involved in cell wall biosynthesis
MRILYCATDQEIPGSKGGSAHVLGVARGLSARGHEVHVAASRGSGPWPDAGVTWHAVRLPGRRPHLRLLLASSMRRLARTIAPDIIIERYQNFGGEGVLAARACAAPVILEVNAPVIDYPGAPKQKLDRLLLVEPLRRWREWLCRQAALIVTPTRSILPAWIPADRVLEIEWGADTERFRPAAEGPVPYRRAPHEIVVVFAGAFRSWHGAHLLAEALDLLQTRGHDRFHGVFIGDGPELPRVKAAAARLRHVTFTGPVAHDVMPAALAAADLGAAPFDVEAHAPLQLAFYWSPLKIFEYMAAGLPIVAPRISRLAKLVEDGREGVLYAPPTPAALADALLSAAADAAERRRMGAAARARAVRDYSWQAHCARLEGALHQLARTAA